MPWPNLSSTIKLTKHETLFFKRRIKEGLKSQNFRDFKCFLWDGFQDFIFNVFYVKYLKDSDKCNTCKCDKLYLVLLLRNTYRNGSVVTKNILWDTTFKYYNLQENNIKYVIFIQNANYIKFSNRNTLYIEN